MISGSCVAACSMSGLIPPGSVPSAAVASPRSTSAAGSDVVCGVASHACSTDIVLNWSISNGSARPSRRALASTLASSSFSNSPSHLIFRRSSSALISLTFMPMHSFTDSTSMAASSLANILERGGARGDGSGMIIATLRAAKQQTRKTQTRMFMDQQLESALCGRLARRLGECVAVGRASGPDR